MNDFQRAYNDIVSIDPTIKYYLTALIDNFNSDSPMDDDDVIKMVDKKISKAKN